MKTNYEEMYPHEFKATFKKNSIAFLPLGSLEYHGYHNVLGLDSLKAWKICQLAAEKTGGIVFPQLYLGVDAWSDIDILKYSNKQFDCYHLDAKLYQEVLENYFYRMVKIGFKKIFVLAGHYPNVNIAKLAAKKYQNVKIIVVKEPDLIEESVGDHAGKWETSLLMVLFPKLVNLKLMEGKEDRLKAVDGEDPINSTVKYGSDLLKKMVFRISEL